MDGRHGYRGSRLEGDLPSRDKLVALARGRLRAANGRVDVGALVDLLGPPAPPRAALGQRITWSPADAANDARRTELAAQLRTALAATCDEIKAIVGDGLELAFADDVADATRRIADAGLVTTSEAIGEAFVVNVHDLPDRVQQAALQYCDPLPVWQTGPCAARWRAMWTGERPVVVVHITRAYERKPYDHERIVGDLAAEELRAQISASRAALLGSYRREPMSMLPELAARRGRSSFLFELQIADELLFDVRLPQHDRKAKLAAAADVVKMLRAEQNLRLAREHGPRAHAYIEDAPEPAVLLRTWPSVDANAAMWSKALADTLIITTDGTGSAHNESVRKGREKKPEDRPVHVAGIQPDPDSFVFVEASGLPTPRQRLAIEQLSEPAEPAEPVDLEARIAENTRLLLQRGAGK